MPRRVLPVLLLAAACAVGAGPPPGEALPDASQVAADEQILEKAGVAKDGPALVAYVRRRTPRADARETARRLVEQLGDDSFEVREKATAGLIELGPVAIAQLRPATRAEDLEQRRRAQRVLGRLEATLDPGHVPAAARLLGLRRAEGATAALLAYLPEARDGELEDIVAALPAVACPGRRPVSEVLAALADAEPVRRGAAAHAVASTGRPAEMARVLPLLNDRDAGVRTRAALALARVGEKKAVEALIDLTGEVRAEGRADVDDALSRLAGDKAPEVPADDAPASARQRRAAWQGWWAREGAAADLGRLNRDTLIGYTLAVVFAPDSVRVMELGRDGKAMWTIPGLSNAVDARLLPGNRVLIAEYGASRVTERTFDGKIVWERGVAAATIKDGPVLAQRLANGHTFITTMAGYYEIDRDGKEVLTRREGLRAAFKYRDGRIAFVTNAGVYVRLNAAGLEERRYTTNIGIGNTLGGVDFLPDGGLLVVRNDRVVQFDPAGKEVWTATGLMAAYCPTRLDNGHTLVACTGTRQFLEYDRAGRVVRKLPVTGTPWVARRR